jgi:hypothetical protein
LPKGEEAEDLKKSKVKTAQEKGIELPKAKAKTSLSKPNPANESKIPKPKASKQEKAEKSDNATQDARNDVTTYSDLTTLHLTDLKEKGEESLLYSTAVQSPDTRYVANLLID